MVFTKLKMFVATALIASFGAFLGPQAATAATVSVGDVGSTVNVGFTCDAGDPCPDSGNSPLVDLSATAAFTFDSFTDNGVSTFADFTVVLSNTSTDGTSRITALGFATDPDGSIGSPVDGNADGINWNVGSGFISGFNGIVELCAFATNSCTSASGGASNGVQAGASDTFGFTLTFAGVIDSFSIDNFAIKVASVENSNGGSYEFGGDEIPPVPIPAAGFLLIGALGGLVGLRRRRKTA